MKVSNIIGFLILLTVGISAFLVLQNNEKDVWSFNPNGVYERNIETFEQDKADARNKILLIGIGITVLLLIIYFSAKKQENKTDPLKNLESLKNNSILTTEEYNIKIAETKNLKQKENAVKEKNKFLVELKKLKDKEIISQSEYLEKVKKIEDKFNNGIL